MPSYSLTLYLIFCPLLTMLFTIIIICIQSIINMGVNMELKKAELAKKLNVSRQVIHNWIKRDGKLYVNKDKKIDTEYFKNKPFLEKEAPFLYVSETKKNVIEHIIDEVFDENNKTNNDSIDNDTNDIDIDSLNESKAKEFLKILRTKDPRKLLLAAQYKKAEYEGQLKQLELDQKLNLSYDRQTVHSHFVTLIQIYYNNRRQIPYNSVDEIIKLVLNHGLDSRGKIIAMLDNKFLEEILETMERLKHLMDKELAEGKKPNLKFYKELES